MDGKADALRTLIETMEVGEWSSVHADNAFDVGREGTHALGKSCDAFHGSLDAAKALHDAVLPGWSILLHGGHHGVQSFGAQVQKVERNNTRRTFSGVGETIARAWLIAILKALLSMDPRP